MLRPSRLLPLACMLLEVLPACDSEKPAGSGTAIDAGDDGGGSESTDPPSGPACATQAAAGMSPTPGVTPWPSFSAGELVKVNSLTGVIYEPADYQLPNSAWGVKTWWMYAGSDPWSEYPYWGSEYVDPDHNFTDDEQRWRCGYSYVVELPDDYDPEQAYPIVIFLHGSVEIDGDTLDWYHNSLRGDFHRPQDDPYIYVAPIKLEIDWDAKKVQDVIEDVKTQLSVDEDRIYLTGLSMGGRGTLIVASELPDTFAAILPLSPHHDPYSYLPLVEDLAHLPIWMMHGEIDEVSSFTMAALMADALDKAGAIIEFQTTWGPWDEVGHWGWEYIYSDPEIMEWTLAWIRSPSG